MKFTLSGATYRRWLAIAKDPAFRQGFTVDRSWGVSFWSGCQLTTDRPQQRGSPPERMLKGVLPKPSPW